MTRDSLSQDEALEVVHLPPEREEDFIRGFKDAQQGPLPADDTDAYWIGYVALALRRA